MADARCSFDGEVVSTVVLSSSSVTCHAPRHTIGVSSLRLVDYSLGVMSSGDLSFQFTPRLLFTRLSPSMGPVDGGTPVTVHGAGFRDELSCRFGGDGGSWSSCESVTSEFARCRTPSSMQEGPISVAFKSGGTDTVYTELAFLYYSSGTVTAMHPMLGEGKGSVNVTVVGKSFFAANNLACRFGQDIVPASFLSSSSVTCVTPPTATGRMMVSVSMNGVDYFENGVYFEAVEASELREAMPSMGMAHGGDTVTILGKNFDSRIEYLCAFGEVEMGAVFVSDVSLRCVSPATGDVGKVGLGVQAVAHSRSREGLTFEYKNDLELLAIVPSSISKGAGTSVFVIGRTFLNSSDLSCRVGGVSSPGAQFVTSSVLRCHLPELAAGVHSVGVVMDDAEFQGNDVRLIVGDSSRVFGLEPSRGLTGTRQAVTVIGSGFAAADALSCRFGSLEVPAEVQSSDRLICHAPVGTQAGLVSFYMTMGGLEIAADGLAYDYVHSPIARQLEPSSGHVRGGTSLTVTGANMPVGDTDVRCFLGDTEGMASVASSSVLLCITPPGVVGTVPVVLTGTFGVLVESGTLQFTFVEDATVSTIAPCTGSMSGGSVVLVAGSDFGTGSQCMFGSIVAAGVTLVSSTQLACTSPTASTSGL
ncbi:hypothetical protein T484DRAFT_2027971, partial [Baffinella frigidus]